MAEQTPFGSAGRSRTTTWSARSWRSPSELELSAVLERFVEVAAAPHRSPVRRAHGASTNAGCSTAFVSTGVPGTVAERPAHGAASRSARSVRSPRPATLRLTDVREHPAFRGIPPDHPSEVSFLGTSVHVGARVFGQLYLSEKPGGFTQAGRGRRGVARLGGRGSGRQRAPVRRRAAARALAPRRAGPSRPCCSRASTRTTRSSASSRPPGTSTRRTPPRWRCPAWAASCSSRSRWAASVSTLLGAPMPPGSRAWTVIAEGKGLITSSLARARTVATPAMRSFGPALFAPCWRPAAPWGC